jgi:hypothetical protein
LSEEKIELRRKAIRYALKNPAQVETSERRYAKYRNGYAVFIGIKDKDKSTMHVKELHKDHIIGEYEGLDICLSNKFLALEYFLVGVFRLGGTFYFEDAKEFLNGRWTFIVTRKILKERISQWLYNRTTKFRNDRYFLLKKIIEIHVGKDKKFPSEKIGFLEHQLFSEFYGNRAYSHPDYQSESSKFNLTLKSLVESNALKYENFKYYLGGHALTEISEHELEDRRHRQKVSQTWVIVVLTAIIALSALIDIFK